MGVVEYPSKNKCEKHKAKKSGTAKHCISPFVLNFDVAPVLSVDDFSAQRVSYELLCSEAKPARTSSDTCTIVTDSSMVATGP